MTIIPKENIMVNQEKITFYSLKDEIRRSLPINHYILTPTITEKSWHCKIYQISITEEKKKQLALNMSTILQKKYNDDVRIQLSDQLNDVFIYALEDSKELMSLTFLKVQDKLDMHVVLVKDETIIFEDYIHDQDGIQKLIEMIINFLKDESIE